MLQFRLLGEERKLAKSGQRNWFFHLDCKTRTLLWLIWIVRRDWTSKLLGILGQQQMAKTIKTYSAINLLDKIFEFVEMTPSPNEWNLKSLKSNPPRQIRFRQIEALLTAFFVQDFNTGLLNKAKSIFSNQRKMSIDFLLSGKFLKYRTIDDYPNLVEFIKGFVEKESKNIGESKQVKIEQLVFIFPKLIDFKRQIRNLLTFNSGWLEASSITSLFSIYLTNSISNNLAGKYNALDSVIELFINPKGLIFTEDELITKFNFPSENLDAVDADFM